MPRRHLHALVLAAALLLSCSPASPPTQAVPTPTVSAAPPVAAATSGPLLAPTPPPAVAPAAPVAAETAPPAVESANTTVRSQVLFSGDEAKRHVDVLAADIGSRAAGSEAQARAAEYVREQLAGLGYQVDFQPFPISFFDDRGSSLTVGAAGRAVRANTMANSPPGTIEGELVDVGLGRSGDFSDGAVRGRIALIERGEIRFGEKIENVARAGAAGAIIYNNQPGNFSGNLGTPSGLPAVSIAQEEGQALSAQLRGGPLTARLTVDAVLDQRTARNVVGTKPGGPQTIVIGGHLDSVPAGPGGNDNASGTAVMLELARVLAERPSPFTIKFVAFDAEEIGLLGSAHMVGQLTEEERRSVRAMINLDMVGVGDQVRIGGTDEMIRLALPISARLGEPARPLGDGLNGASDHASFMRAGIPAVFLYRSEDPNYHSPNDLAAWVDPAHLQFAGQLALGILDALEAPR